jgi:hypothetical protein
MSAQPPFTRHNAQIAVGFESDHGVSVTPDTTLGKIVDAGDMPDPTVEWQEERTIGAESRELSGKEPGQNAYDGGSLTVIPVDLTPFEFLFGQDESSGKIEVDNAALPRTMTVEATYYGTGGSQSDFVRTFVGNAPDAGTISVDNESRLTVDLDFIAQGVTTGSSPTDVSAASGSPWLFHDAQSNLSLAGTSYARVTDFEWELSNNVNPRHYIHDGDAQDPFEIPFGNADHEVSATITPSDDQLYQDLIGRDDAGTASIAFERENQKLTFTFDKIGFTEAGHPMADEGSPEVGITIVPDTGYIEWVPDTTV